MNISIISDCNNNCAFCFQKDFHKKNLILSYEEIEDIIKWGEVEAISIQGGEPTLHPDIVKIMHKLAQIKPKTYPPNVFPLLISNMLGETEVFKELAKIRRISFLINTNYTEKLKDHYHNNFSELMKRLLFIRIGKEIGISLTLTGVEKQDAKSIDKLFETLALYNRIIKGVRIGICVPSAGVSDYKLINYDEKIRYIVNKINIEYKGIYCSFDCLPNNCQVSHQLKCELSINKTFLPFDYFCINPNVEILPDKSIIYCFACPDGLKIDNYKRFKDVNECRLWYSQHVCKYILQSKSKCQLKGIKPDCEFCEGCCLGINNSIETSFME